MRKVIELTFQIFINKVSCPGVWLCQDGLVSLSVYALGCTYQTAMVTPVFPLVFNEVFYFRKSFPEICSLNNIFCLLKDDTIYCELVQWCTNCNLDKCTVLARYLGALNDVLFPLNVCPSDGVDLLMRRSTKFPGILAPKIEITTKVRIDEVVDSSDSDVPAHKPPVRSCECRRADTQRARQSKVCHTSKYHRNRHSPDHFRIVRSDSSCDIGVTMKCSSQHAKHTSRASTRAKAHSCESLFIDSDPIEESTQTKHYTHRCVGASPCTCDICTQYYACFNKSTGI